MAGTRRFSSDEFEVEDDSSVVGDQEELGGALIGGNDTFYGDSYGEWGYTAYGDGYNMYDRARGGNDVFYGGDEMLGGGGFGPEAEWVFGDYGVVYAGDAGEMGDKTVGGNDSFYGGLNSSNVFVGDALYAMYDRSRAGNDRLEGGDAYDGQSLNMLVGDAYAFESDKVVAGTDQIYGGDALAVDGYDSQVINLAVGDAYALYGSSGGRNDTIHGGAALADDGYATAINLLMGDGYVLAESARGGSDTITGGNAEFGEFGGEGYAINVVAGDAYALVEGARAGNDTLYGGNAVGAELEESDGYAVSINMMAGDTLFLDGAAKLGNDKLFGGSGTEGTDAYAFNLMYGDVLSLDGYGGIFFPTSEFSVEDAGFLLDLSGLSGIGAEAVEVQQRYGNDTLTGGETQALNFMVGDAGELYWGDQGGNDVLHGGGASSMNQMVGDAHWIYEGARGGNDRLISGAGDDQMWGDASEGMDGIGGADRFVFRRGNGSDSIEDFRKSDGDKIDLSAFDDLFADYSALAASGRLQQQESGVWIDLSEPASEEDHGVLVVGVSISDLGSAAFLI